MIWKRRLHAPRSATEVLLQGLFVLFLVLLYLGPALAQSPNRVKMGIMTGGPKGTYYQFGLNLQKLFALTNVDLRVTKNRIPNWGSSSRTCWLLCHRFKPIRF
jgi:hypothetical protein